MRTADDYRASLRDGRVVYFQGERIEDVTTHAETSLAVKHAAIDFELADDPAYRELAMVQDERGERSSLYWQIPRTTEDLLARARLIEASTRGAGTLVTLIREIGSDALFALMILAERLATEGDSTMPDLPSHIDAYLRHCRQEDLAVCVAQTDVKGDRRKAPADQAASDLYLRVIEERTTASS